MQDEIIVKNLTEELVDKQLNQLIKDSGVCKCARCKADIRAIALNHLPTNYVATEKGALHVLADALFSSQSQTNIIIAITQGINAVVQNPRHDPSEKI